MEQFTTLALTPDSFSPATLSVRLPTGSISDDQGVANPEVTEIIDFRPHRTRESDLFWFGGN